MKSLVLMAVLSLVAPNVSGIDAFNGQVIANYNVARSAMLAALTPPHKRLLGAIAARLATSVNADYADAARQIDSALSPAEKHAILLAANDEHQKMRVLMRNVGASVHGATVLHIGAPPLRGGETAGFVLIHTAMNLGPMTMNAMIVSR